VEQWDTSLLYGVDVDLRIPAVVAMMGLFATAEVISSAIALGTTRNSETLVYEPEEILDLVGVNEDCTPTERVAVYAAGLVAVGFHLLDVAHLLFTPGRDTLDYGPSGEQAVDEITSLCEPDDLPSPEEFCAAALQVQQRLVEWYSGMHACFIDSPVTLSPHDVPLQSRGRIGELLDMVA
jgi:hypothetical protein